MSQREGLPLTDETAEALDYVADMDSGVIMYWAVPVGGHSHTRGVRACVRLQDLKEHRATAKALVAKQAEDEGLWFEAATAPEAYLQEKLRDLHEAVERL